MQLSGSFDRPWRRRIFVSCLEITGWVLLILAILKTTKFFDTYHLHFLKIKFVMFWGNFYVSIHHIFINTLSTCWKCLILVFKLQRAFPSFYRLKCNCLFILLILHSDFNKVGKKKKPVITHKALPSKIRETLEFCLLSRCRPIPTCGLKFVSCLVVLHATEIICLI